MLRMGILVGATALSCVVGCAYPRRSTTLTEAGKAPIDRATQPKDLWGIELVSAEVPREKRGALSWDDKSGLPDVYFVLRRKGRELWKSPVLENTLHPKFDKVPKVNLTFDRDTRLSLELWDKDSVGSDPIGMFDGKILGEAILEAETIVRLDSGATLTLRITKPKALVGSGIAEYEVRPSSLYMITIVPNSPASRAGLERGDKIISVGGKAVKKLTRPQAASALALAAQKKTVLVVERGRQKRNVTLDNGPVWPSL